MAKITRLNSPHSNTWKSYFGPKMKGDTQISLYSCLLLSPALSLPAKPDGGLKLAHRGLYIRPQKGTTCHVSDIAVV